ncbi:hypothetical protein [Fulvimonas yonginensis]|uniref:J domain-containing protein n=1 Tax=Fulvimonas yonginensis TaxID=1495200 RepID=A0ABU8JAX1_9GAMM
MDAKWFLTFLELSPEADERAIKRAYAARLKRIDPTRDLEGFAQLRQAYEAALRWLATQPPRPTAAADGSHPLADGAPSFNLRLPPTMRQATASATVVVPQPAAPHQARTAMEALARALDTGASAPEVLAEQLAHLHGGHLDAATQFECMLIDALAQGRLPDRAALFEAACQGLGWMDVTRLAQLGARGRWIEGVLAEEPAWRAQVRQLAGANWFEWIGQRQHGSVPRELASQWPCVVLLSRRCPQQLRLRLSPATLSAWQAAFDALPALDRDLAETYAGLPSPAAFRQARPRVTESRRGSPVWAILAGSLFVLNFLGTLGGHSGLPASAPASAPAATVQPSLFTGTLCSRINAALHMPGAPQPRDARDRSQLADAVRRCIVTGHWRALPDPQLRALGIGRP